MDELMIKVENVTKEYRLGAIGGTTLRDELQRWRAKRKHQEDPTLKIGQTRVDSDERFMALNGVSFEVKKGEAVGIIGHNGAGKSTLLKLITRITAPTGGDIYLNGRVASMLEVGTGFHGELTGRENIYLNGAILGMSKKEIDAKMEKIIEFSEVRQFIDTPVKRYSSGMYVKLAFSVAAHLDSEIMIMDEVLAVGDMAFQNKCIRKMREIADSGKTILYVSHNMNTIRQLCDRCIVLEKGKLIFEGDVEAAISVYMKQDGIRSTKFDYSGIARSPYESRKLQLMGLTIVNREDNVLQEGEKLEFILHCRCNANCKQIGFRFELFSGDGMIVGTMFSDQTINGNYGKLYDLHTKMSTCNLAPGIYKAVALTYEYDKLGNQIGVDRVDPAMNFEIVEKMNASLKWLSKYWGHVHFNDMEVVEIRER
ncbi:MAG: ATP-binding cassette domain-containing protein [Oscillospiraceae bacterium]|nr:ATP-binding cassette domain-containing protein [Oscillospiraceae bacterium]